MSRIVLIIFIFQLNSNAQEIQWDWVKSVNESSVSVATRTVIDAEGNVYVSGSFDSPAIDIEGYILSNGSFFGTQVYLAKYNQAGDVMWARTFEHPADCSIQKMLFDNNANLIILGIFNSDVTFDEITLSNTPVLHYSTFLAKLSPEGTVISAIATGNNSTVNGANSYGSDMVIDEQGNIFVAGTFENEFVIDPQHTLISDYMVNFYVIKYDPNGLVQWVKSGYCTYVGGFISDVNIALNTDGNVFVSSSYIVGLNFDGLYIGSGSSTYRDGFLAKFDNSSGDIQSLTKISNSNGISINGLAGDSQNSIYILGTYYVNPLTIGETPTLTNEGYNDIFLAKINPAGQFEWSTKFGSEFFERAWNLTISDSKIYICGAFTSPELNIEGFILSNPAGEILGPHNAFLAIYNLNGQVISATAGQNIENVEFYDVSATGANIYVAGYYKANYTLGNTTLFSDNQNMIVAKINPGFLIVNDEQLDGFGLFPNPANNYIELTGIQLPPSVYQIIDISGRIIASGSILNHQIPVDFLSSGVYILEINGFRKKFIKSKTH